MNYQEALKQALYWADVEHTLEDILKNRGDNGELYLYFRLQQGTIFRSWGAHDDAMEDAEGSV